MNGYRKSKGLVIELTALLDIIMIMLFWVMTDASSSADNAKEDAKAQVQAAQVQLEQQKKQSAEEIESLKAETEKQIEEAYKKAENINSTAAENQSALDGYANGMLISLNLRNENGADRLYISRNNADIMNIDLNGDIEQSLGSLFQSLGADDGTVMLAAVVYDGNAVLYRSMNKIESAIDSISDKYENLYFTYINISK